MQSNNHLVHRQSGISLIGLILSLGVLAAIAVLAANVVPTVVEFISIKKAIVSAQKAGTTVQEIKASFDKTAQAGYFTAVSANDLVIVRSVDGNMDVSFAYSKKIPLFGPASLLMEYEGTTAKSGAVAKNKLE